jgi:hypothetical protein
LYSYLKTRLGVADVEIGHVHERLSWGVWNSTYGSTCNDFTFESLHFYFPIWV